MINSSAVVLEFDPLRGLLRGYTTSELGNARLDALTPSTDPAWIGTQQQLTAEVREFRRVGGRFEFAGLTDVTQLLDKSGISGAVLETDEIHDVITAVDRAAEWREIDLNPPQGMKADWLAIKQLSAAIADFTEFLR